MKNNDLSNMALRTYFTGCSFVMALAAFLYVAPTLISADNSILPLFGIALIVVCPLILGKLLLNFIRQIKAISEEVENQND